jgi:hypothetical protein
LAVGLVFPLQRQTKSPPLSVSGGLLKIGLSFYDLIPPPWALAQTTNERCIEQMLVSGRFAIAV